MSRIILLIIGFIVGWFLKDSNWEEWLEQLKSFFEPKKEKTEPIPLLAEETKAASNPDEIFPDPLEKLTGIGPAAKKKLNDNGIYTFKQIANLTPDTLTKIVGTRVKADTVIKEAKKL